MNKLNSPEQVLSECVGRSICAYARGKDGEEVLVYDDQLVAVRFPKTAKPSEEIPGRLRYFALKTLIFIVK